jgi:hypothetical protein
MQEALSWTAALCMAWSSIAMSAPETGGRVSTRLSIYPPEIGVCKMAASTSPCAASLV